MHLSSPEENKDPLLGLLHPSCDSICHTGVTFILHQTWAIQALRPYLICLSITHSLATKLNVVFVISKHCSWCWGKKQWLNQKRKRTTKLKLCPCGLYSRWNVFILILIAIKGSRVCVWNFEQVLLSLCTLHFSSVAVCGELFGDVFWYWESGIYSLVSLQLDLPSWLLSSMYWPLSNSAMFPNCFEAEIVHAHVCPSLSPVLQPKAVTPRIVNVKTLEAPLHLIT